MELIHLAAQGGHVNIVNVLVNDYGVNPNSKVKLLQLFGFYACLVTLLNLSYFAFLIWLFSM